MFKKRWENQSQNYRIASWWTNRRFGHVR